MDCRCWPWSNALDSSDILPFCYPYLTEDVGLSYTEAGILVSTLHISSFIANFGSGMVVDVLGRRVLVQAVALFFGAFALMLFGISAGLIVLILLVGVIGATNNLWHPAAISFLSAPLYEEPRLCAFDPYAWRIIRG